MDRSIDWHSVCIGAHYAIYVIFYSMAFSIRSITQWYYAYKVIRTETCIRWYFLMCNQFFPSVNITILPALIVQINWFEAEIKSNYFFYIPPDFFQKLSNKSTKILTPSTSSKPITPLGFKSILHVTPYQPTRFPPPIFIKLNNNCLLTERKKSVLFELRRKKDTILS